MQISLSILYYAYGRGENYSHQCRGTGCLQSQGWKTCIISPVLSLISICRAGTLWYEKWQAASRYWVERIVFTACSLAEPTRFYVSWVDLVFKRVMNIGKPLVGVKCRHYPVLTRSDTYLNMSPWKDVLTIVQLYDTEDILQNCLSVCMPVWLSTCVFVSVNLFLVVLSLLVRLYYDLYSLILVFISHDCSNPLDHLWPSHPQNNFTVRMHLFSAVTKLPCRPDQRNELIIIKIIG